MSFLCSTPLQTASLTIPVLANSLLEATCDPLRMYLASIPFAFAWRGLGTTIYEKEKENKGKGTIDELEFESTGIAEQIPPLSVLFACRLESLSVNPCRYEYQLSQFQDGWSHFLVRLFH